MARLCSLNWLGQKAIVLVSGGNKESPEQKLGKFNNSLGGHMPILIEEILEREHQRDSEWEELIDELHGDPELWEVYVDNQWIPLTEEITRSTKAIERVGLPTRI